jgi:hypothetical protein
LVTLLSISAAKQDQLWVNLATGYISHGFDALDFKAYTRFDAFDFKAYTGRIGDDDYLPII